MPTAVPPRPAAPLPGAPTRTAARAAVPAAAVDAACVLAFVVVGRSSHAEDGGVASVLGTAWPFLVAGAVGWLAARAWRRPGAVWPTGVVVWALTWAGGLALRGLWGDGLAPAFVAVAAVVLAALLVGWRAVATAVSRASRRPLPTGSARGR